jgi:hypothetical protein
VSVAGEIDGNDPADKLPWIELRIPGPWGSPMEIVQALRQADVGYELRWGQGGEAGEAGEKATLLHLESGARFSVGATDPDDEIADIFAETGRLNAAEVKAIQSHRVKVFVSGAGGSLEAARAIMAAGAAMVHAGGVGVMVDNSAAAHSPRDWLALAGDEQLGGLYWAFVVVTGSPREVFSSGMHCLGFRDAELPDPPDLRSGAFVLHNFLGYSYQSGATILDGEAIGGPEGVEFVVRHFPCTRFAAGSPWHNPYGVWRLEQVGDEEGE